MITRPSTKKEHAVQWTRANGTKGLGMMCVEETGDLSRLCGVTEVAWSHTREVREWVPTAYLRPYPSSPIPEPAEGDE
jgi:hypothetical protein